MTPLQEKLLEMLTWYSEFCNRYSLNYYVTGGTMLGAARHKGFIPWDDDIDVCMPRPDYNKFLKLTQDLSGRYYVDSPYSDKKDFVCTYAKIYDSSTTLVEKCRYPIIRGVFIDVFPVDGVGNSLETGKAFYNRKIDPIKMFHISRITSVRKGRSLSKNAVVLGSHIIPGCFIDNKKLAQKIDEKCQTYGYEESEIVGNLMSTYRGKSIFPKTLIGNYSELSFEGITVKVVEQYDDFLSLFYGDWRKLPPEEKRVTAHDFIQLDLNKPHVL